MAVFLAAASAWPLFTQDLFLAGVGLVTSITAAATITAVAFAEVGAGTPNKAAVLVGVGVGIPIEGALFAGAALVNG